MSEDEINPYKQQPTKQQGVPRLKLNSVKGTDIVFEIKPNLNKHPLISALARLYALIFILEKGGLLLAFFVMVLALSCTNLSVATFACDCHFISYDARYAKYANFIVLLLEVYFRFIPSIWITLAIALFEGLLGGGVYVNAFYRVALEVEPKYREFSMGAASMADSSGITLAGALSMPLHSYLCTNARTPR